MSTLRFSSDTHNFGRFTWLRATLAIAEHVRTNVVTDVLTAAERTCPKCQKRISWGSQASVVAGQMMSGKPRSGI
ncbi:hypothetical protein [Streptomyces syringium]|uniref:hypothetical protein n=1 Tax=Streptomyces syringium TaxID=76729 RepID=UPI003453C8C1